MNDKSRPHLRINGERLISSIREMGSVGFHPESGGRTRLALTDEDKAGRDLLCRWMRDEGLEVKIDEIGNIFGKNRKRPSNAGPARRNDTSRVRTNNRR